MLSQIGRGFVNIPFKFETANTQPGRFTHAHTPANKPSRTSSGFNLANSLKISFDRSS